MAEKHTLFLIFRRIRLRDRSSALVRGSLEGMGYPSAIRVRFSSSVSMSEPSSAVESYKANPSYFHPLRVTKCNLTVTEMAVAIDSDAVPPRDELRAVGEASLSPSLDGGVGGRANCCLPLTCALLLLLPALVVLLLSESAKSLWGIQTLCPS